MRQVFITRHGGPEVLQLREAPNPAPRANEIALRVHASGINFADIMARKGLYPDAPKPACVVGYEVAGVIEAVGADVKNFSPGQEVLAMTRFGGYSDFVCVPAFQVFSKPSHLNMTQAAAVLVTYVTAYQLMVVMGSLRAGETVLIHNAGSGVGLAELDLAKKIGARTIGTASASKHDLLRERGFDHVIDYRKNDWLQAVLDLTQGRGVELVLDPIGGAHWKQSYRALRATGRLGLSGVSTASAAGSNSKLGLLKMVLQMPWFTPVGLMNSNKGVFGVNLGHLWEEEEKALGWIRAVLQGVDEGWVRPQVDRTFTFAQTGEAHAYIEARRNFGKVVLIP